MVDLTLTQIRAINAQIDLGLILQRDYSFSLAERWVNGDTIRQIALDEEIPTKYGVTQAIAIEGVRKYLCGHNGSFGIPYYEGMVPEQDRKKICREHRMSSEAMPLESRVAKGKHVAARMGLTTWLTEDQIMIDEKDLALALTLSENYRVQVPKRGQRIGDINYSLVVETLNQERESNGFPQSLTVNKVRKDLYKYKKQREKNHA